MFSLGFWNCLSLQIEIILNSILFHFDGTVIDKPSTILIILARYDLLSLSVNITYCSLITTSAIPLSNDFASSYWGLITQFPFLSI